MQRHRPEIFDGHARRRRGRNAQFVELAHGVVEDGGNDSTMTMTRWAGVTLAKPKMADIFLPALVSGKLQVHSAGIIFAAGKAIILAQAA